MYDFEKADMMDNYEWLQPFEDEPVLNRNERKTVYNRRNTKASEEEVSKTFKEISSALRVEHSLLSFVPTYPHRPQTLIASALNSQIHK